MANTNSVQDIEILVVDDDHDLVQFIELDLATTSYHIEHAYTIESAKPIIDSKKYDFIVSDIL